MLGTADNWRRVEADVLALPDEEVQKPRIDLQIASEVVLSVCDAVADDAALTARFQTLTEAKELSVGGLGKLRRYAAAAWYARRMQRTAEATEGEAVAPPELIAEGDAILGRMQLVAGYHLVKHPAVASVLSTVSAAPGHRRLANNLLNLADVYQEHRAAIAGDTVNYRATDERDARKVASSIITHLSDHAAPTADVWNNRCARIWTLLNTTYAEVQAAGQYLLWRKPDEAKARFPSLVAEARSPAQPRKAAEPAQPEPPAQPTDGAPAQPAAPADATAPRAAKRKRRSR